MVYKGEIKFPKMFNALATEISILRSKMSEDVYHKGSHRYRGDREEKISWLGIMGELIVRHYFEETRQKYKPTPLVDFKPIPGPDVITSNCRIDVKCADHNGLFVNDQSYKNNKGDITHYLFIILKDEENAELRLYSYEDVGMWELKDLTYTPAYVKYV